MKNLLLFILFFSVTTGVWAEEVEVYDKSVPEFTTNLANGSILDTGTLASDVKTVLDKHNSVYTIFTQNVAGVRRLFINRLKNGIVQHWDANLGTSGDWTITTINADPIDIGAGGHVTDVSVVCDKDNNLIIAYTQNSGTFTDNLYVTTYNDDLLELDADNTVLDPNFGSVYGLSLITNQMGFIYLTYLVSGEGTLPYMTRYNPIEDQVEIWDGNIPGTGNWTTTFSNATPVCPVLSHTTAIDSAVVDGLDVVFTYRQYDGTSYRIYAQRYISSSNSFSAAIQIDNASGSSASNPNVVVTANNDIFISYRKKDVSTAQRLYLTRYTQAWAQYKAFQDSTGLWAPLNAAEPIDAGTGFNVFKPKMLAYNNHVYIIYISELKVFMHKYDSGDDDVLVWDVDTQSFANLDVTPVGDTINRQAGIASTADINMRIDYAGNVYVISALNHTAGATNLYMVRYNGAGIRAWNTTTDTWSNDYNDSKPIDAGNNNINNYNMVIDGNGVLYYSYANDSGTGDINMYQGIFGRGKVRTSAPGGRRSSDGTCVVSSSKTLSLGAFILAMIMLVFFACKKPIKA